MSESATVIEGVLLVNKPKGRSSFNLIPFLRKRLNVKKIGHAGTLDPFATGVMVYLVGKNFTRKSDSFLGQSKEYVARVKFGVSTDSYDCDGEVVGVHEGALPTVEAIEEALKSFQGVVEQVPPMFSAKKVGGKKLYELARKGEVIERKPVRVEMESVLLGYDAGETGVEFIDLKVKASKGTYIRSIAHDLGEMLGCGAHLVELCRTKSGEFCLEACVDGEKLEGMSGEQMAGLLKSHIYTE